MSVAFYTLHYGSISRGVTRGQWGRNYPGAKSPWGAEILRGRRMIVGAPKSPNNVTRTFCNTVHLLPEDLRFENGAPNLLLALDTIHVTSLRPCQSGD